MPTLLLIHALSTWAMTGVIWFVQLVHYPLFAYAAIGDFRGFAGEHQRRTARIVAPLMLVEAVTATLLLVTVTGHGQTVWLGWGLLVSIWLATAFVQVPLHRQLAGGFDSRTVRRLVASNWWRTAAWTARAGIAASLLFSTAP